MELAELRKAAREIFANALRSVNASDAIRRAVRLDGSRLTVVESVLDLSAYKSGIYIIAIGKAAWAMAGRLAEILGPRIAGGVISGSAPHEVRNTPGLAADDRWQCFNGGHPLPNEESLKAAQAAVELLKRANAENALVLFLISGGGSAMIEWPLDDRVTLDDLRHANQLLVSCGATITEINAVRRVFSAVKGGSLAARAPQADQITLIVSDTNPGDEASVASGPTLDQPCDLPDPIDVLARCKLTPRLPKSIRQLVGEFRKTSRSLASEGLRKHYVLLDNQSALDAAAAAARGLGFYAQIANDIVEQQIEEGCQMLLSRLEEVRRRVPGNHKTICLISGGEFACSVRGDGTGGRNAETVLRCAIEIDAGNRGAGKGTGPEHVVVLSAGTDGIDGNSPAAGAMADERTIMRARTLDLDAQRLLEASNAFSFFNELGDAIVTGATGTNARDVRILLADSDGRN
jgi:glycerate 2-kinase